MLEDKKYKSPLSLDIKGIIDTFNKNIGINLKNEYIILIIKNVHAQLATLKTRENYEIEYGPPPEINLTNEKNNGLAVLRLIRDNLILSAHDISSGGMIVSLAEMAISSKLGLKIFRPKKLTNVIEYFFAEDQLIIHLNDKTDDKIKILGERKYEYDALIMNPEIPISISGSFLEPDSNYEFEISLRSIYDSENLVFLNGFYLELTT